MITLTLSKLFAIPARVREYCSRHADTLEYVGWLMLFGTSGGALILLPFLPSL